jgi:WD40 repeat protein
MAWSYSGPDTTNQPLMLATGSSDGTIKLWDIEKGKERGIIKDNKNAIKALSFSPNSEYLASGGNDSTLQLYSLRSQKVVKTVQLAGTVSDVAWSWDNQILAAAYPNNVLLLDLRYL